MKARTLASWKVTGYTAQARFYAANMERPDGEWKQVGWIPDRGGSKPVWELLTGTPVAIYDGVSHLTIHVREVPFTDIRPTEEACFHEGKD